MGLVVSTPWDRFEGELHKVNTDRKWTSQIYFAAKKNGEIIITNFVFVPFVYRRNY